MNLKKIGKHIAIFLGLIFSFLGFANVYAYPSSGGVELELYNSQTDFYSITQIPASVFSSSDCSNSNGTIWYSIVIYKADDTLLQISNTCMNFDYNTVVNQGYWNTNYYNLQFPYSYPETGDYYFLIVPSYLCNNYDSCGVPPFYAYVPFHVDVNANTISSIPISNGVDGVCGSADGVVPSVLPIPDISACSAGTVSNMHDYLSFEGYIYSWYCMGEGDGISVSCESDYLTEAVNGVCGSANGQTVSDVPVLYEKCFAGIADHNVYTTLNGWSWTCWGISGGDNANCSATNSTPTDLPILPDTTPIPTPTDCSSQTGLDKIVCNITNTIEGMFYPTKEKINEFWDTVNSVNDVFPFSYLSVIGSIFSGQTITEGGLSMTFFGNTASLPNDFFDMPLFAEIKKGITIIIYIGFFAWAISYIKHFFK